MFMDFIIFNEREVLIKNIVIVNVLWVNLLIVVFNLGILFNK